MKRYIALLRGINISEKNKLPMAELKQGFKEIGYAEIKTYLNSENMIFSGEETDTIQLTNQIEEMIKERFCSISPFLLSLKKNRRTFYINFSIIYANPALFNQPAGFSLLRANNAHTSCYSLRYM